MLHWIKKLERTCLWNSSLQVQKSKIWTTLQHLQLHITSLLKRELILDTNFLLNFKNHSQHKKLPPSSPIPPLLAILSCSSGNLLPPEKSGLALLWGFDLQLKGCTNQQQQAWQRGAAGTVSVYCVSHPVPLKRQQKSSLSYTDSQPNGAQLWHLLSFSESALEKGGQGQVGIIAVSFEQGRAGQSNAQNQRKPYALSLSHWRYCGSFPDLKEKWLLWKKHAAMLCKLFDGNWHVFYCLRSFKSWL